MRYMLLHGFLSSNQSYFLPKLHSDLKMLGHTVLSPSLSNPSQPILENWIMEIMDLVEGQTKLDCIVAHSLGGLLALQLLSQNKIETKKLILISSSFGPKSLSVMNNFLSPPIDIDTIKNRAKKIYTVFSFDDPWTESEYGILQVKQLQSIGITYPNQGHFENDDLPEEVRNII